MPSMTGGIYMDGGIDGALVWGSPPAREDMGLRVMGYGLRVTGYRLPVTG
jgi:hypothetical protein